MLSFLSRKMVISVALATLGCLGKPSLADFTIDTTKLINDTNTFGSKYGGQTFLAPQNSVLTSFSLFVVSELPNRESSLILSVAPYDVSTHLIGPALFTSSPLLYGEVSPPADNLYTFDTGHLALNSGQEYVAYFYSPDGLEYANFPAVLHDNSPGSSIPGDAYPGGDCVFGNYLSEPFVTITDQIPNLRLDLGFRADFVSAPVPEASSVVSFGLLLALGMGGLVIARRKKFNGERPSPIS